jgi:hypothetical protein
VLKSGAMIQSKRERKEFNTFSEDRLSALVSRVSAFAGFETATRGKDRDEVYVQAAKMVAMMAHEDQYLKVGGHRYVTHPMYVASQFEDLREQQVALLHDVLEKSNITAEHLLRMGFDSSVVDAVRLLTRDKSVPYLDYIRNLSQNAVAAAVKIEDIKHNTQPKRVVQYESPPPKSVILRRVAYTIAQPYLEAIQEGAIPPGTSITDFICDDPDFLKNKSAEDLYMIREALYSLTSEHSQLKKFDERINAGLRDKTLPVPTSPKIYRHSPDDNEPNLASGAGAGTGGPEPGA